MAEQAIKAGFIGAANIAGEHARALFALGGFEFAGHVDSDEHAARQFARLTGSKAMSSAEKVIAAADTVWVCTPPKLHRRFAESVLAAGKNLYCEKPLAADLADAQAIAAAADEARGLAAIGFNFRLHAAWQKLKELVEAGELGEPVAFFFSRIGRGAQGGWRRDPAQMCGMTVESVSHNVDMIRFILGEVGEAAALQAASDKTQPKFDDCLAANFKMASGAIGSLQATWASALGATRHVVAGREASAIIEGPSQFEFTQLRVRGRDEASERVFNFPPPLNSVYDADLSLIHI